MEYVDGGSWYLSHDDLKVILVTAVSAAAVVAANAIHEGKSMSIRIGFPTILNFSVE